ncbi:MAG TPA: PDZ domain-containing protein [Chitinophagaceae bacterium]
MKQIVRKPLLVILGAALLAPAVLLAQPGDKEKTKEKEKKDGEVITIIRKGDKSEKVVVEVNGDKVTVNGKPVEEYKGEDVTVMRSKIRDTRTHSGDMNQNWNMSGDNFRMYSIDSNRAMLGVTTEKTDKGVEIQDITKESAAAKAGLKEGDIITTINDKKIETPDDLSKAIKAHKPGEKVTVTYLRDDKKQTATAELGKWKGASVFSTPGQYKIDMGDFDMGTVMPKIQSVPRTRTPYGQSWSYSGGAPKLGLSVQDTDDGKGVKVIEVDDESNAAKAGIKNNDLITQVDGKATNSTDEIAKIIKESKDKTSVMIKLLRGGKTHNIEVKIPRKIKTADL